MKVLEGTIPELREKAIKFIMGHIRHGVFFDANRRYDRWEYPLRAIEEVLNNALAHRDYFSNAEIQLSIYDNRIEVWNPGELPKPLTPQDLKRKHKSIPRNKLLAHRELKELVEKGIFKKKGAGKYIRYELTQG